MVLISGVAGSNGALWHNNRRFTLRQLRELGMGKSRLVDGVQHQALKLRESLAKQAGKPGKIPHQLYVSIVNVIWHMVASEWGMGRIGVVGTLVALWKTKGLGLVCREVYCLSKVSVNTSHQMCIDDRYLTNVFIEHWLSFIIFSDAQF